MFSMLANFSNLHYKCMPRILNSDCPTIHLLLGPTYFPVYQAIDGFNIGVTTVHVNEATRTWLECDTIEPKYTPMAVP